MSNQRFSRALLPTALACTMAITSFSVLAATPEEHGKRTAGHARQPVVLSEAYEKILAHAAELDANTDGRIDAAEILAAREKRQRMRTEARLSRLDTNGDGSVSVEEFVAHRQSRLTALDTDADGIVSAEEFRQAGPKRHSHGPRSRHGEKPVEP